MKGRSPSAGEPRPIAKNDLLQRGAPANIEPTLEGRVWVECAQCGPIRHRKSSFCPFCGRSLRVISASAIPVDPTDVRTYVSPLSAAAQPEDVRPVAPAAVASAAGSRSVIAAPAVTAVNEPVRLSDHGPVYLAGPVSKRPHVLPPWVVGLTALLLLLIAAGYLFAG